MRRLATVLAVFAVAGVAIAALVNTLVDSGPASQEGTPTRSTPQEAPAAGTEQALPECGDDQLALAFDNLGGDDAVALRHVQGEPCRGPGLTLQISLVDRKGRLRGLPLGNEADLSGEFSPGFERVVRFNGCRGAGRLRATATAGPYSATSWIRPGSSPCISAVQRRIVRLGRGRDSAAVTVQPLDPTRHAFTVRMTLPPPARIKVRIATASGLRIRVLDAARRNEYCRPRGPHEACVVPFAALGPQRAGEWIVWVRKSSPAPARIPLSITFEPVD